MDGLEVAVGLNGSGAMTVAEHAAVHFSTQLPHLAAILIWFESSGLAVESFDLFGDAEVLLSHGLVGDSGVDHGHREGLVDSLSRILTSVTLQV